GYASPQEQWQRRAETRLTFDVEFLRPPLCPAGLPGPSLPLRAFVARKAKQLASRPLRGSLLNPLKGGDWQFERLASLCNVGDWRKPA
ncbi:hypothetical protein, partial [Mesorhizobium sp. M2A.F.Ca.ET.042.01.1.1]|uniref:hypothetical protein n=1 Tax=Mesorhizobium sp. M2A.F.Ca.ET.042.01.1.1 TaxID=2496745 RepID=UPI001AED06F3